jgi:hypothetical protein
VASILFVVKVMRVLLSLSWRAIASLKNEQKFTYEHLQFQNFFGLLALAIKGRIEEGEEMGAEGKREGGGKAGYS